MSRSSTAWSAISAGDLAARDRLVREHLSLVHHVAQQLARTLSTETDAAELVSAGTMGLLQAVESFDPTRGLAFSTLAVPRIRGAMLDELRRLDPLPRGVRRRAREIARVRDQLAAQLGRRPTAAETAEALAIDTDTLWRWEADLEHGSRVPLERPGRDEDGPTETFELALADQGPSIDDLLTADVEHDRVRTAVAELRPQERTVLALYYFEELRMAEIAEVMGLTESRVSQIRSSAIAQLRLRLAGLREGPVATTVARASQGASRPTRRARSTRPAAPLQAAG